MKKFIFSVSIIVSLLAFSSLEAQSYKDSIRNQFIQYFDLLSTKKYAESISFINPEFLKLIPKEKFVELLEKTMNSPEFEMQLHPPVVISLEDSRQIKGTNFVRFQYEGHISMRFVDETSPEQDTDMLAGLQESFGEENVKFNASTKFYEIQQIKNVIADSKDQKHWTFIVVEERQKPILEKFIPKELL